MLLVLLGLLLPVILLQIHPPFQLIALLVTRKVVPPVQLYTHALLYVLFFLLAAFHDSLPATLLHTHHMSYHLFLLFTSTLINSSAVLL